MVGRDRLDASNERAACSYSPGRQALSHRAGWDFCGVSNMNTSIQNLVQGREEIRKEAQKVGSAGLRVIEIPLGAKGCLREMC